MSTPALSPMPVATDTPVAAPAPAPIDRDKGRGTAIEPTPRGTPVFIVRTGDGTTGRLVVDQWAERDGWAMVEFARGMAEEVELTDLSFERIE